MAASKSTFLKTSLHEKSCCSHDFLHFHSTDTLELYYIDPSGNQTAVPLVKKGIAWWTDKHVKFRNPAGGANLSVVFQGDSSKLCSSIPVNSAAVPSQRPTRFVFFFSFFFLVPLFRHQQAGELEEASVRAGRVGSRQQRFHQRGPDRVDANGRPADLSQAVPHHPEEAQHGADAAQRQLHPERHIQYPLVRGHKLKPSSLLCLLRSCTMRAAADVCLFLM